MNVSWDTAGVWIALALLAFLLAGIVHGFRRALLTYARYQLSLHVAARLREFWEVAGPEKFMAALSREGWIKYREGRTTIFRKGGATIRIDEHKNLTADNWSES